MAADIMQYLPVWQQQYGPVFVLMCVCTQVNMCADEYMCSIINTACNRLYVDYNVAVHCDMTSLSCLLMTAAEAGAEAPFTP